MYLQQINEGFKVESLIFWRGLSETDTSSTVAENLGTFSNTEFLVLKLSPLFQASHMNKLLKWEKKGSFQSENYLSQPRINRS